MSAQLACLTQDVPPESALKVELEGASGTVDVAIHHLASPDRAAMLAERLRAALPRAGTLHESEVGAVVGAHVGPGLLGVVVRCR